MTAVPSRTKSGTGIAPPSQRLQRRLQGKAAQRGAEAQSKPSRRTPRQRVADAKRRLNTLQGRYAKAQRTLESLAAEVKLAGKQLQDAEREAWMSEQRAAGR